MLTSAGVQINELTQIAILLFLIYLHVVYNALVAAILNKDESKKTWETVSIRLIKICRSNVIKANSEGQGNGIKEVVLQLKNQSLPSSYVHYARGRFMKLRIVSSNVTARNTKRKGITNQRKMIRAMTSRYWHLQSHLHSQPNVRNNTVYFSLIVVLLTTYVTTSICFKM